MTSPDRIDSLQLLPAFVKPDILSGTNTQPSPPLFEERELPGRGRGLIATKTLHRGDRLFADTPILLLDEDAFEKLDEKDWVTLAKTAVNQLPPRANKLFWELYGHPESDPVSDRINTNSFEVETEDITHYAVLPEIARLNHDCRPNAAYFFDSQALTHHVHAITTISPGTEISITYIDPHMLRKERLKRLYSSWGFNCSCSLCSLHSRLADASDARLLQIEALTNLLEETETASSQAAQTLISLYEQERLYAPMSAAYRHAALTSCEEGNLWNTMRYAQLAFELGMLDEGFRDIDVRLMELLAEQPEAQPCWPKRVNWRHRIR